MTYSLEGCRSIQLSYRTIFPTLRLLMSSYFGFLFLKNLRGVPLLKHPTLLRGVVSYSFIPMKSHSRRRLSAELLFKS